VAIPVRLPMPQSAVGGHRDRPVPPCDLHHRVDGANVVLRGRCFHLAYLDLAGQLGPVANDVGLADLFHPLDALPLGTFAEPPPAHGGRVDAGKRPARAAALQRVVPGPRHVTVAKSVLNNHRLIKVTD